MQRCSQGKSNLMIDYYGFHPPITEPSNRGVKSYFLVESGSVVGIVGDIVITLMTMPVILIIY